MSSGKSVEFKDTPWSTLVETTVPYGLEDDLEFVYASEINVQRG